MRIGLAQIDSRVGDLRANSARILDAAHQLRDADLVVFPEMVLPGYPPRDLLLDDRFLTDVEAATRQLAQLAPVPMLVGTVQRAPDGLHNGAAWLQDGAVRAFLPKRRLPRDDVFHETRWFTPGGPSNPVDGWGVLICEDMWHPVETPAERLLCLSASPYRHGILERRLERARRHRRPLVYVNAAGANDELIFDGGSFAVDDEGRITTLLPRFAEALRLTGEVEDGPEDDLREALVSGIRGFARKNGLRQAVLGLSGGVDSALAACLAAEALGPGNVTGVALPSRYNDPRSEAAARELAENLGLRFHTVALEPLHAAAEAALGHLDGTAAENVQARLRAMLLMAFVNRDGGLLLNTSNKTELALGYGTLYGDLAGSLCPLGDLTKSQVYDLARRCPEIPRFVLDRPPSAELRPGQVDPFDYDRIAPVVEALVQGRTSGLPPAEEADLKRRIAAAEHKRWQAGIVLKVSDRAFGSGRMMPVTARVTAMEGTLSREENFAIQSSLTGGDLPV